LYKEQKVEPGRSGDAMEHPSIAAEEERKETVEEKQQQKINRPDAKKSASEKIPVEVRGGVGVEDDSRDEKSGEHEEETDSGPAPDNESLEKGALEARVAMVKENYENRESTETIERGNEGGQPRRA